MIVKKQRKDAFMSRLAAKDATEEERKKAAAMMGRAKTPKKVEAAIGNLSARTPDQMGGRPRKSLTEIPCNCTAGDDLQGHRWNCPRGQAIKRRQKNGEL